MIITIQKCLVPQCEGASHKWEFERPTLREIERMEDAAGIDIDQFATGLSDVLSPGVSRMAIKATLALVDILHRRDGIRVPYEDIDIDIGDFDIHVDDADLDEPGEPGEDAGDGEGKDPAPTPPSHPHEETAPAEPGSGPATEAASEPKSSPTPTASGGGSASP